MYSTRGNLYAFASILDWTGTWRHDGDWRGLRARRARSLINCFFVFFVFCWKWRFCFGEFGTVFFYFSTFLLFSSYPGSREDLLLVVLVDALLDLLHSV